MSGNIKTIKFTAVLSAVFAILTYIITLNVEVAFFAPNWPWISNNFALTVCGGIFASTLVVMLCEVQKYLSNKSSCENYLFYQTVYLYLAMFLIQKITKEFIDAPTEAVSENLLEDNVQIAQCQLNAIQGVDYTTFSSKNELLTVQNNFCSGVVPKIKSFLSVNNYLKRAILTVQIANVEQFGVKKPITTTDPLIFQTLSIINEKSLSLIADISNYLQSIDNACHNRFAWEVQKQKIHEGYTSIFTAGRFEDFLKQGE